MRYPRLVRSLDDLPVIHEDPKIIHEWYSSSTVFASVMTYDRGQEILDREVGYVFMNQGSLILPLLRVCANEQT